MVTYCYNGQLYIYVFLLKLFGYFPCTLCYALYNIHIIIFIYANPAIICLGYMCECAQCIFIVKCF